VAEKTPILEIENGNLQGKPGMVLVSLHDGSCCLTKVFEADKIESLIGGLQFMAKEVLKEQRRAKIREVRGD